ncbi:MAG TPA: hypothetical protein VGE07_00205, partial [Herpetosiphonaceae bacterium]
APLAARLAGAVEQALLGYNTAMQPIYEPAHRQARRWAEGELGAAAFRAAWEVGAAAPLEQMIDEALDQRPATRSGDGD